ncbi:Cof-type HAD-IIB family hydrolase [Treponema primitia]|uniref:HAD family hydrolase n=1 Tax=Treponema primitia TaxID=88058 RepID=UPI0039815CD1
MFNNVKLIAADMDHTLLTEKGDLPPNFDDYIYKLERYGINFVIASGRPLYTLEMLFQKDKNRMSFIADNGGVVTHNGTIIFKSLLDTNDYQSIIRFVEAQTDGIAILCGLDSAYISEKFKVHEPFLKTFYAKITFVKNLSEVVVDADKFTIYFPQKNSKTYYEKTFHQKYSQKFSVTVGDTLWIDIMNKGINKGKAIELLGIKLDIESEQMMAFGDTYNDIEMLQMVKYSYLVENAVEDMKQYARFITASNDNFGVIKIIDKVLLDYQNNATVPRRLCKKA